MRKLLASVLIVSIAAIAGLTVLPGSLHRLHPAGPGGGGILVPDPTRTVTVAMIFSSINI
jgi:hypothetical protein